MSEKPKLTKAEAGRLGGLKGGKISRGGGRPRKYQTEAERRAARVRQQQEHRKRKRLQGSPLVVNSTVLDNDRTKSLSS